METAFRALVIESGGSPSLFADRVFPVVLPQAAPRPSLTYQVISGPRLYSQDGAALPTTFRVQLDIWADTYEDTRAVRDALLPTLTGAKFAAFGSPPVVIQAVFVDNERDLYESELNEPGPLLFRKSIDLLVTAEQR